LFSGTKAGRPARLFLGGLCLLALPPSAFAGPFLRFERLLPEFRGATVPGVSSILQGREGFLWFGTNFGLARYDGYRFDFFSPSADPGKTSPPAVVYPIFQDGAGDIWIGTAGQGLFKFDRDREAFQRFPYDPAGGPGSGAGIVLAIQEDRKGDLWVGTRVDGLLRLDRSTRIFTRIELSPDAGAVWDLLVDRDGFLWIGTEKSGLFRRDPATDETINFRAAPGRPDSLGNDAVWTLFQDRGGEIWVGTSGGGLHRFLPESRTFFRFTGNAEHPRDLVSPTITALGEDGAGRLWIGTSWSGLRVWDRGSGAYTVLKHDSQDSETISDDNITSILTDASGVVWIGTARGGINKNVSGAAKFAHFKHERLDPRSLSRNDVRALSAGEAGRLWVGFDEGLDEFDERTGRLRSFRHDPAAASGFGPGAVLAVLEDRRGRVWAGLEGGGLASIESRSGRVTRHRPDPANPESLSGGTVTAISPDRADPDVLWIGTNDGLNRLDTRTGRFKRYLHEPSNPASLSGRAVLAILEDRDGALWVGTQSGLNRLDKATGACVRYVGDIKSASGNGPSNNIIHCLHEDAAGNIWLGTENGLNRFDRKRGEWRYYLTRDGLPGEVVRGILEEGSGALWVSTNRGLARFDPPTGAFTAFGVPDGAQNGAFNSGAFAKGADGRMRFGGVNGYNVFLPGEVNPDPFVPPVVWTGFSLNGRRSADGGPLPRLGEMRLSGRDRFISFEFAALAYADSPSNSFAYKLEPRDRDWISLGHDRAVSFSSLPPGRHVLRVKAASRDGVWNEDGVSLALTVTPPFWRTGWFFGLLALVLVSGTAATLRMRTKLRAAYLRATPNVDGFIESHRLTAREAEILRLILQGAGNKDIAGRLFISASTVRNHISHMYQKLGVKSRIDLINRINRES